MKNAINIDHRLKQAVPFVLKADLSHLQAGDRRALELCVFAARTIDEIYLEQVYKENLSLFASKGSGQEETKLARYLSIHGGPWDRWEENEPFVQGVGPKSPGANFYPEDMDVSQWTEYLRGHPQEAEALKSPYTLVERINNQFRPRFFHEVWAKKLESVSRILREASKLCSDEKLKEFLRLRAEALLTDEYVESDAAWIEVDESPIEITIGPYEVYEDTLFNLKASYEAVLVVRDSALSERAKQLSASISEFDAQLAKRLNYVPHGNKTPMIVGDLYFGAGDLSHNGYQTMAYNLPNDERTKAQYGSKKVFLKNIMQAKFEIFTKPIAERLFEPSVLRTISHEAFVTFILGHEIAHGVGPEIIYQNGETISVKRSLGNLYSLLEEAKADIVGMVYLSSLAQAGTIDADLADQALLTHMVDMFRTLRFGPHEDHARGVLIQYNWLQRDGVLDYDHQAGRFSVRKESLDRSLNNLADAIMATQRVGNYQMALDFVTQWSFVSEELKAATEKLKDLPIDLEPIFEV
jgi:hypothetical protein